MTVCTIPVEGALTGVTICSLRVRKENAPVVKNVTDTLNLQMRKEFG